MFQSHCSNHVETCHPPYYYPAPALLLHQQSSRLRRGHRKGADFAVREKDTGCYQQRLNVLAQRAAYIVAASNALALDVKGANFCQVNKISFRQCTFL
jgi:hypothetical protein